MTTKDPWQYVKQPDRHMSKCIPEFKNHKSRQRRRMARQYIHVWELEYGDVDPKDIEESEKSN